MTDSDVRGLTTTALLLLLPLLVATVATMRKKFRDSEASMADKDADGDSGLGCDESNYAGKPCDSCTQTHASVRLDAGTGMQLCDGCWFVLPPKFLTSGERERRCS